MTPDAFVVLVTMTPAAGKLADVERVAASMVPVFAQQPGLLSMTVHRNHSGTKVVSHIRWRSRADHEACQNSPSVMLAGAEFMRMMSDGSMTIEMDTFDEVRHALA